MKRQRGRGRKPGGGGGGNQPNRTLESTGPDVKIRGSASHIYEKYLQLSRDAMSSGDRIGSESYLQHAEHYYRMLRAMQPQQMPQFEQRFGQDYDFEDEGAEGEEAEGAETPEGGEVEAGAGDQPYVARQNGQGGSYQERRERGPRPDQRGERAPQEGEEAGAEDAQMQGDQDGFRGNRRRRNRGRYRPGDERGGGGPRGPDGGGDQNGPVEGFGETVPAFVSGD
jgi:hypothetical protein